MPPELPIRRNTALLSAALGRPTPLAANDLKGDMALLRFLLGGRYRFLEDRGLVRLCGAMRTLLCVYVLFFLALSVPEGDALGQRLPVRHAAQHGHGRRRHHQRPHQADGG